MATEKERGLDKFIHHFVNARQRRVLAPWNESRGLSTNFKRKFAEAVKGNWLGLNSVSFG